MATQSYPAISPQEVRSGMTVRVHQKIKEKNTKGEDKERIQVFEGTVLNVRGSDVNKTMTVRKMSGNVGVERIFPLSSPVIAKLELVSQIKTRRKVITFLRKSKKHLRALKPNTAQTK
ncbi:MAG: 50S ribosomal protein L19 [Patescibacteria group bacterium]|jgi:large subunit ribosomal protein L19